MKLFHIYISRISFFAVLALVLIHVEATASSCTGSNAVAHDSAACLEASWNHNAYGGTGSHYSLWKRCNLPGRVGVRLDMESGSDRFAATYRTVDIRTSYSQRDQHISNIYCCLDREGGFCNGLGDLLTNAYCSTEFNASQAVTTAGCTANSATADVTDAECDLSATCSYTDSSNTTRSVTSSLSIGWQAVRDSVHACDGTLQSGAC